MILVLVGASACRPASEPAPLAPDEPDAGSSVAASPTTPTEAPPPSDDEVGPSPETVCAAYAKAYCEPGDGSPDAIRPEMRDFLAVDCQKSLLEAPEAAAETMRCVESTKDCGQMRACLPKPPDAAR
jgi:hypothetical protein